MNARYADGTPARVGDVVTCHAGTLSPAETLTVEEVDYHPAIGGTVRWHDPTGQGWSLNTHSPRITAVASPLPIEEAP